MAAGRHRTSTPLLLEWLLDYLVNIIERLYTRPATWSALIGSIRMPCVPEVNVEN